METGLQGISSGFMEKQYGRHSRRWLIMMGLTTLTLTASAQTVAPPIQWQQVIEGGGISAATVLAVKTSNGGYAVVSGKNLIRLSATGTVLANSPLTGTYQDSTATYAAVQQTLALAATPDGGATVLALDALNQYYVIKLDAASNRVWTRPVANANTGSNIRITASALVATPDRSLLVAGTFSDGRASYLTLTSVSADGYITGEWRIPYPDASQSPVIRRMLTTADGGYLLVGQAVGNTTTTAAGPGQGLAVKLNKADSLTWQRTYPAFTALLDIVVNPSGGDVYTAIGPGVSNNVSAITIAPNGATDGRLVAAFTGSYATAALVNDGTGNLTVLDGTSATTSDFRLTNVAPQSVVRWTKTVGGSGNDLPAALLGTDGGGYLLVGTTTSTDGDVAGKSTSAVATWVVKLGTASAPAALSLTTPLYNCQTGVIVFNTMGGDGTPITYTSPGVGRTQLTDNFGTVEPGVRNDPKVLVIQATQSRTTVNYTFDFRAYCRSQPPATPAAPNALMLIAPTYNCQTGAITFHTTGGDSTTIEYAAPGITTWTTNPNQFVEPGVRTDYAIQPLTLMARQSGKVVLCIFDLKAECGRARIGAAEAGTGLAVSVVGNPVRDAVKIQITGAGGQSLLLHLLDAQGRLVENRTIDRAAETEQQTFDLHRQAAGVLMLRITANQQVQTVKVVKQ